MCKANLKGNLRIYLLQNPESRPTEKQLAPLLNATERTAGSEVSSITTLVFILNGGSGQEDKIEICYCSV